MQEKLGFKDENAKVNGLVRFSSGIFNNISKHKVQLSKFLTNRGSSYSAAGDYSKAVDDLARAISVNPELFEAYYSRGLVYKNLREWRLAENDFSRAIELNARSSSAYFQRISVNYMLNDFLKTHADLDMVLSYDRNNKDAYYYKSKVFMAQGNYLFALRSLLKAQTLGYDVDEAELVNIKRVIRN